jgi:hypothetical protein
MPIPPQFGASKFSRSLHEFVMPGLKREARLQAECAGHPRLGFRAKRDVVGREAFFARLCPAMTI